MLMFGCKEVQGADPLCRHRARKSLLLSYYNLWGSFSDWISGAWEQPAINTKTSSVLKPWSRSVRARGEVGPTETHLFSRSYQTRGPSRVQR